MPREEEAAEKQGHDVACTGEFGKLLRLIGKPHTLEIIYGLSVRSPMRFSEIQRQLKVQPKTLTTRLHDLVRAGLLSRTTYNEIPPRVDYALSEKGKALGGIICSLRKLASQKS
jgi:DNA-binding HxlR family transcriptional regulator